MNVEIGTEAAQFPEKEYMNGIFLAVHTNMQWIFSVYNKYNIQYKVGDSGFKQYEKKSAMDAQNLFEYFFPHNKML